ncbi:MAG: ACP S-malonyltransferase [Thermoleophilaceae bacterium]|nr:ACP S-malonyltransferase [Thermoleophilaceae bacterium]
MFAHSVESFKKHGVECDYFLGHSLGSYAALVAAGSMSEADGERVVAERGLAMAAAASDHPGAMLALLGCSPEGAEQLATKFGLTVANDNAPGQIVITGAMEGIEAIEAAEPVDPTAGEDARRLRLKRLPVSGAFHSPLIESAAARLSAVLADVEFADASRVIANGTAQPYVDPRRELAEELLGPVRFRESLLNLWALGVTEFVEFEPGGVLTGLVKRTLPEARAVKVADLVASS